MAISRRVWRWRAGRDFRGRVHYEVRVLNQELCCVMEAVPPLPSHRDKVGRREHQERRDERRLGQYNAESPILEVATAPRDLVTAIGLRALRDRAMHKRAQLP